MTRALIAARKSTKVDGREGFSLHTQDEHTRAFCERQGWEVVGVARDTISGRVAPIDRKDLGTWLAEPLRFDVVAAYRTDRLSRGNQEDWTRIEHWATENSKTLVMADGSTGIRYPARDDSDFWQWQATKREAGREWESSRERNLRSQAALVAGRAVTGRAPFGFRIVGERYAKRLEVFEPEARLVREVFERIAEGESTRAVGEWLSEASGHPWSWMLVARMVGRWTYAGRLERNGEHYADCPAIVSPGELVRAQKAMQSRARKSRGGRPPLDGPALMVMTCGECGGKMYRGGTRGRSRGYYCRSHTFGVPAPAAEAAVLKTLTSSKEREKRVEVIKGHDWADEIETLKRDRRQALERDDEEAVARIWAQIKELQAREVEPDRVEPRETDRTYGEIFGAMTREELRAELRGWKITAWPDGRLRVLSPFGDLEE